MKVDVMVEHKIRQRAYELYEAKVTGSTLEDWLLAEREVLTQADPDQGVRVLSTEEMLRFSSRET